MEGLIAALESAVEAGSAEGARAAADALGERWLSDDAVAQVLAAGRGLRTVVGGGSGSWAAVVGRALSGTGSLDAVGAAVGLLGEAEAEGARRALAGALASMTGRVEPGADAWEAWWLGEGSTLSEDAFARRVARWQTQRANREAAAQRGVVDRLTAVYRRLYVASDAEGRGTLLVELLESEREGLRLLGYDLAEREAVSARPVGEAVIEGALAGLSDGSAVVREAAAALLYTVRAEGSATRALEALRDERDAYAAAAMLRVLVRRPVEGAVGEIVERLSGEGEAGGKRVVVEAAIEAALAYERAYGLGDDGARERVLAVLREMAADGLTAPGVRLLARLGERGLVVELLRSRSLPVAQAAADVLKDDAAAVAAVVSAARENAGLFEAAVDCLLRHRATAAGYAEARGLVASSSSERERKLREFAAALPAEEVLTAADAEVELAARERLLSAAVTGTLLSRLEGADGVADGGAALRVVERLLRTREALGDAVGVVRLAERLPERARGSDAVARSYVEALVRLNRLDEAARADDALEDGAVRAWLEGLRASVDQPHARGVVERMQAEFGGAMSAGEAAALAEIEAGLPSGDDGGVDAGGDTGSGGSGSSS